MAIQDDSYNKFFGWQGTGNTPLASGTGARNIGGDVVTATFDPQGASHKKYAADQAAAAQEKLKQQQYTQDSARIAAEHSASLSAPTTAPVAISQEQAKANLDASVSQLLSAGTTLQASPYTSSHYQTPFTINQQLKIRNPTGLTYTETAPFNLSYSTSDTRTYTPEAQAAYDAANTSWQRSLNDYETAYGMPITAFPTVTSQPVGPAPGAIGYSTGPTPDRRTMARELKASRPASAIPANPALQPAAAAKYSTVTYGQVGGVQGSPVPIAPTYGQGGAYGTTSTNLTPRGYVQTVNGGPSRALSPAENMAMIKSTGTNPRDLRGLRRR